MDGLGNRRTVTALDHLVDSDRRSPRRRPCADEDRRWPRGRVRSTDADPSLAGRRDLRLALVLEPRCASGFRGLERKYLRDGRFNGRSSGAWIVSPAAPAAPNKGDRKRGGRSNVHSPVYRRWRRLLFRIVAGVWSDANPERDRQRGVDLCDRRDRTGLLELGPCTKAWVL